MAFESKKKGELIMMMEMMMVAVAIIPQPQKMVELGAMVPAAAKIVYENDEALGGEAYRLKVKDDAIIIGASTEAGRFYALKTLEQLREGDKYHAVVIEDAPAFKWRGMLLDEGRHFHGKETVKHVLDLMADYKFNVFHWHLTEDQGWRIDIPGMPELVKYGSYRSDSPAHGAELICDHKNFIFKSTAMAGEGYGPYFYTEKDLREIVAYAAERHITVVPEIDIPGHSIALLAAYPQLCCFPKNIKVREALSDWGITTDVLCVGNDETVEKLEKIFNFLCDVFPSEVIHLGGDECPRVNWKKCAKCQARVKAEGLKDESALQAWITSKVVKILEKRGRRAMGWDEILAGDIPKTAIGQSWRTREGSGAGTELVSGATGAERGFDMVMSPHEYTYYNYDQGLENDPFQRTDYRLPFEKAYKYDPLSGVSDAAKNHVLGGQCCLWGEYIWNRYDLDWRMWPRALVMTEVLWRYPEMRNLEEFINRASIHREKLLRRGVNCAPIR